MAIEQPVNPLEQTNRLLGALVVLMSRQIADPVERTKFLALVGIEIMAPPEPEPKKDNGIIPFPSRE